MIRLSLVLLKQLYILCSIFINLKQTTHDRFNFEKVFN